MSIVSRDMSVAGQALRPVAVADVPERHPVRVLDGVYNELHEACEGEHLPDFRQLLRRLDGDLVEYCMALSPVAAEPFIDFVVLRKGARIPGIDLAEFQVGQVYSQHIVPDLLSERLMELASCLALRQSRLTEGRSARRKSLDVKVYRGVFPVWDQSLQRHIVVLAVAPIYATVAAEPA